MLTHDADKYEEIAVPVTIGPLCDRKDAASRLSDFVDVIESGSSAARRIDYAVILRVG